MKMKTQILILAALLPATLLTLTSCSTTPANPAGESTSVTLVQSGVPGGTTINTYQVSATVTAIDRDNRKVTLVAQNGAKSTVTCGPEVVNFPQIEVGDQVRAAVTERLVVYARDPGEPANDGAVGALALAPIGDKPGGAAVATEEITATVKAIDTDNHTATLQFPDGSVTTFKVRPDVQLGNHKVGDLVVFRTTDSIAISVEKP
ncbi:MAG TPA: hypothetical protein VNX46_08675 [Candidatus Acidoferrum sp.]|nr:hypothetical protein [Candidatus Acidoferrum sp.]